MTLARHAKIHTATTRAVRLAHGHAVAIKRFDRSQERRLHALTANVALKAAGEELGYPELAQLLRRRGVVANGAAEAQMRELFRRMVFNILVDNTDDHEKNHALLVNDQNQYELSPGYDILPSGQALGYQQLRVGNDGADSTLANALSECEQFGLDRDQARTEIGVVATAVAGWRKHFEKTGVSQGDIELIAEQVDRSFLRDQRAEFAKG
jgi:serine/threonine-protein kinase HipA